MTEQYVHLSGWAFQEDVKQADKLYKAENNPHCLPQSKLRSLVTDALGAQ